MNVLTKSFFHSIAEDVCMVTNPAERKKQAISIGKKLAKRNNKFNHDKWLKACNVNPESGLATHINPELCE